MRKEIALAPKTILLLVPDLMVVVVLWMLLPLSVHVCISFLGVDARTFCVLRNRGKRVQHTDSTQIGSPVANQHYNPSPRRILWPSNKGAAWDNSWQQCTLVLPGNQLRHAVVPDCGAKTRHLVLCAFVRECVAPNHIVPFSLLTHPSTYAFGLATFVVSLTLVDSVKCTTKISAQNIFLLCLKPEQEIINKTHGTKNNRTLNCVIMSPEYSGLRGSKTEASLESLLFNSVKRASQDS